MYKNNLKRMLREKGISQKEFGKMVGFSQNMICYYLSGRSEPSIGFFLKAAEVLGVSLDEICYGVEAAKRNGETPAELEYRTNDKYLNRIIDYYKQLTQTGQIQLYYSAQSYASNPALSARNTEEM